MKILKQKLTFKNQSGNYLSALLERPENEPVAYALFAHCFTCSKNIATATRISRALAARGIAVMRFDFTGIGDSEGDFSDTNFSSNIQDLIAASRYLSELVQTPKILIGHSLGGAAAVSAAGQLPEIKAVATIAAPSDPAHILHLLRDVISDIEQNGWAHVEIGGQRFKIKQQFIEDVSQHNLQEALQTMNKAYLILHSSNDELIEIEHAHRLFEMAHEPKQFVSLGQAGHLLNKTSDAEFAAETIADWVDRYL